MKKSKLITIVVLLAVLIGGPVFYFTKIKKAPAPEYVFAKAEKGKLVQTVNETGIIKVPKEYDLSFLQSGKVSKLSAKVGDKVKIGQVLAELDYSSLIIKEKEISANLDMAKADMKKLLRGATGEHIEVSEASVDSAKSAYDSALDEYAKTEVIVKENIEQANKRLIDLQSDNATDLTSHEQSIKTAEISLKNTKETYQRTVSDKKDILIVTMKDKIATTKVALDYVNRVLTDEDAEKVLGIKDKQYVTSAKSYYDEAVKMYNLANSSYDNAKSNNTDENITLATADSLAFMNKSFESLRNCFFALENSIYSSSFTVTELDLFKTNVNSYMSTVSLAISSMQTAKQNFENAILSRDVAISNSEESLQQAKAGFSDAVISAKNNLASVKLSGEQQLTVAKSRVDTTLKTWKLSLAQLDEIKAPPRSEDILLKEAQTKQAEASLALVKKQIEDSIIKSPVGGVVTKVNCEVGEQVTAGKVEITILSEGGFEVEVDIPESDITKIKIGDKTKITLDAFGEDYKIYGSVYSVEPAETIIQDVVYYKVRITINDNDSNEIKNKSNGAGLVIKPGMTANILISTAEKDGVLVIPARAVIEKNGDGKFVRQLAPNGGFMETKVDLGIRGDGGLVEVLSGLREGENVIVSIKNVK